MIHIPVLLQEVITGLMPKKGMVYLDGTFGAGKHAKSVAEKAGNELTIIAIDRDSVSLDRAIKENAFGKNTKIIPFADNYRNFETVLEQNEISGVDAVLLDLGFSSDQMDESKRGFSFKNDEPLLMTLKNPLSESDLTAKEIVNTWDEQNITDIIRYYGEERYAFKIAKAICEYRKEKEINSTTQLVEIIENAVPSSYRKQKIHPATRTFQALRITVNDELGSLTDFLSKIVPKLNPDGRIAVISFHSLEDRIVKNHFRDWEKEDLGKRITKKPTRPTDEEIERNPRSRSAKLRIFQKTI